MSSLRMKRILGLVGLPSAAIKGWSSRSAAAVGSMTSLNRVANRQLGAGCWRDASLLLACRWRVASVLFHTNSIQTPYKLHTNSIQTPYKFHTNSGILALDYGGGFDGPAGSQLIGCLFLPRVAGPLFKADRGSP